MNPLTESLNPTLGQRAWGGPVGSALVARDPEDFRVDECLSFSADGHGPHLLVQIEKRGLTTIDACRVLADAYGVSKRDFGYAGRKDRWAVTTQWLTLPWPEAQPLPAAPCEITDGLRVLRVDRHRRKLKVGSLVGNHFRLRLRAVNAEPHALNQRLARIASSGVPNYFGPQRFGKNGRNLKEAVAWLATDPRSLPAAGRGMCISALRSECFNRVLSARVLAQSWAMALPDDLMGLDGRESLFPAAADTAARLSWRLAGQTIHPTGPLPGRQQKKLGVTPALAAQEDEWLMPVADWVAGLAERRVDAARRPLRVAVGALSWYQEHADEWVLEFYLRRGSYATAVLAEVVDWSAP